MHPPPGDIGQVRPDVGELNCTERASDLFLEMFVPELFTNWPRRLLPKVKGQKNDNSAMAAAAACQPALVRRRSLVSSLSTSLVLAWSRYPRRLAPVP